MLKCRLFCVFLLAAVAAQAAPEEQAEPGLEPGQLYRYRNDEGSVVMDYSLPPGVAERGYEILSPSGRVVKTVPPESERREQARKEAEKEVDEEQQREDAYIQRSYKTVDEVEQARQRHLAQIRREIDILEANLSEYRRRMEELRDKAAEYQASGEQAPESILSVLEDLEEQESSVLDQIEERRAQYEQAQARFDRYARRLQELTGDEGEAPDSGEEEASAGSP